MNILEYETIQERKAHGDLDFPFNIYPCCIPWDFASVPAHWHNDMELIYVKKGVGTVTVDLTPYTVRQGDIVVVSPGQLHSLAQHEDASMEYENIIFQLSMLMASSGDLCTFRFLRPLLQGRLALPVLIGPASPDYPSVSACLDALDGLSRPDNPVCALGVKGQLFGLLFSLFSGPVSGLKRQAADKSLDSLKRVLKHLETHYQEKIPIEEIAAVSGFSCSHFMKFFKQHMGKSFIDYLNDYRLTMAARMLTVSSAAIVAIAEETGFENLSYFNRLFKRKHGVTPSGFRRREQAEAPSDGQILIDKSLSK